MEVIMGIVGRNWPAVQFPRKKRTHSRSGENIALADRVIDFYALSFRGYYPDSPYKANQDEYTVVTPKEWNQAGKMLFGVFDGHGSVGDKCASFAASRISRALKMDANLTVGQSQDKKIEGTFMKQFKTLNTQIHESREIDDSMSGTTAVVAAILGDDIWVSNVGDSRCIVVQQTENGGHSVCPLSTDQTPYRRDERARVRKYGARVLNVDQIEGCEPVHDNWDMTLGDEVDEGGDPPRIWARDGPYPGTAFTRSIGDAIAEELGVVGDPEVLKHTMTANDKLLIVASDGVWEFLTNKQVMNIALQARSPTEAARMLWRESFALWVEKESRTDDITVIVVDLDGHFSGNTSKSTSTPKGRSTARRENEARSRRGSTKVEMGKHIQGDFLSVE